jgi:hypothetical protein
VISLFPLEPALPRVIPTDLCETIGDLVDKELRFCHFRCFVREARRNSSAAKISASAFRLKSKKAKRLATSTISIRQALNCQLSLKINQANLPS